MSTDIGSTTTAGVRRTRMLVIVAVVAVQLVALVVAYDRPHKVFGWQMFNASSDWQAEVVRVSADGTMIDVREPWPGGYTWPGLMPRGGLQYPWVRSHAGSGLDRTLDLFQGALDWVARNTPDDRETVYLEARVTVWDNGREPEQLVMRSVDRTGAS